MGVLDAIRAAGGNAKVPEPVAASPGATTSILEAAEHPGPRAIGDQPTPLPLEALDYLCRLATQASTDDVIDSALYLLSTPVGASGGGFVQLASTRDVGTIAVLNLGTRTMAVVSGQPAAGPAPQGQGQVLVGPGQLVALPLGGSFHTIYGALNDPVTVVRYASVRDPHASDGVGGAFPATGAGGAAPGNVIYTAPFPGVIPASISAGTLANTGATAVDAQVWDGPQTTGRLLAELAIPVGATAPLVGPLLVASGVITVVRIAGDAGQPKVALGVR